jgi:hypothetical protein
MPAPVKQILFHKNLFFYVNGLKKIFVLRANIPSRHGRLIYSAIFYDPFLRPLTSFHGGYI